ncbi:MAG: peroxiredoxin [Gammaproteobacteria bacterium]|nr:peroxiredoxin [Gammaproteobacteria bacterium]
MRAIKVGFSLLVLVFLGLSAPTFADGLEVGDRAPDFTLQASDGRTYTLSDFAGERAVVLAWFPKAYTSGCTIECKSLAENGHLIRKYQASYFMISVDPLEDNIGFAEQQNADFPLLSDPDKDVARAYGVLGSSGYAKRHTFYIGVDGLIQAIDTNVRPATSAEDMAARLGELGVAAAVTL